MTSLVNITLIDSSIEEEVIKGVLEYNTSSVFLINRGPYYRTYILALKVLREIYKAT